MNTKYNKSLIAVCNKNTTLNAFGFSVTVFITQKCDAQVAKHTNNMLIIRKGKSKVSKNVKKNICERETTAINRIAAEIKKRFRSFVIGQYIKQNILQMYIFFFNNSLFKKN